jgi:hypothetical protein
MTYWGQPSDRTDEGHLRVHLTPGIPKTGLWCPTCLLPSRSEVPIYVLGENGPFCVGTANHCDGCHQ